ncbi:MAG TPA: hypothetical protein VJ022_08950, partial [Anaerolineales bacterium]|nr:hypothetical protein [Anaerolineales bacterium]
RAAKFLKGEVSVPVIRIRIFGGQVGEDRMIVSDAPSYEIGKTYLLFLFSDTGPTADIVPGAYYGTSSPYEIKDGKAVSLGDEWLLEDLIAYIEKSLPGESASPIPTETLTETPIPADTPVVAP